VRVRDADNPEIPCDGSVKVIEKYFELGVRFRWNKPANVDGLRDGIITDSIRPTTPLTYIGLGSVVSPKLMMTHVSTIGLQMNTPIQHQWLDYTPGRTSRVAMGPYDVLTGFMSGCIIARWTDRGVMYAGHVGTVEDNPAVDRLVKRTFAFKMPAGTVGFDPFAAWRDDLPALARRFNPPMVPNVISLVTRGQFYSIAMLIGNFGGGQEYYCGGARLVPPIPHDTLKLRMLREG
jgi:hypothetical protein